MENNNAGSEIEIRRNRIKDLKNNGTIVYAEKFKRTARISEAAKMPEGTAVAVAGRMVFRRVMGKFGFNKIRDIEGIIQVSVSLNELSEADYEFYKKMIDLGDFIGVTGILYKTQTGELTVKAEKVELLSKALRPLPEKFHGLTDQEQKYRQRYLDLIANEESRAVALGRIKITSFMRQFLDSNGFLEVETPVLQNAVSGASARPFYTKHNALNKIFNLRISPEIFLKKCIGAGFDRVYEIARDFRNEGMDTQHLQEFTMCEWYASYWYFEDNIKFFTEFMQGLLRHLFGTEKITYEGTELDFSKTFERVDYVAELTKILGFDFLEFEDRDELVKEIVKTKIFKESDFEGIQTTGGVIDYIYKRKIRVNIVQPTVLYNYPACLMPLARRNDKNSKIIDAFQVLICGFEICKAYSELVDPFIQRETFEEQAKAKAAGDEEAMDIDEDFLLAMEHGMPPISGLGVGIDRLATILFNQPSVRDVVLFPLMK